MKCRDSRIRRQAIALFGSTKCQEGMWEGSLLARFASEVADLEEAGARLRSSDGVITADDVWEEERFSDVVFAVTDDPLVGRLVCATYAHEAAGDLLIWEHFFRF